MWKILPLFITIRPKKILAENKISVFKLIKNSYLRSVCWRGLFSPHDSWFLKTGCRLLPPSESKMSDLCLKNKYMQYVLKKKKRPFLSDTIWYSGFKTANRVSISFSHIRLKINRGQRILVSCGLRYIHFHKNQTYCFITFMMVIIEFKEEKAWMFYSFKRLFLLSNHMCLALKGSGHEASPR